MTSSVALGRMVSKGSDQLHHAHSEAEEARRVESGRTTSSGEYLEPHVNYSDHFNNLIIGFSDGLTVPFAVTAGLSAMGSRVLVIAGGLAELFSGAISMGLGAWLAAESERQHYEREVQREKREVQEIPDSEENEIYDIFEQYGIPREASAQIVQSLRANEDMWVKFMMHFELRLEKPETKQSYIGALVMGLSYFIGGLVPMIPYFAFKTVVHALFTSIGISVVLLLIFGYVKASITGLSVKDRFISAGQTLVVGAIAAGTSYGIVRGLDKSFTGS